MEGPDYSPTTTVGYNTTDRYANTTLKSTTDKKDGWSSFEQFCGYSQFFDRDLLLHDDYPHFTDCFKEVGFVWIPCAIFLLLVPIYLLYLGYARRQPPIKLGGLNISKMVMSFALLCLCVTKLIVRAKDDDQGDIVDAEYVSEGLKAGCFLITLFIMQIERMRGVLTSFLLWTFWLVTWGASIVPFYSNFEESAKDHDNFGYIVGIIYFSFLSVQLVLASFAEKRAPGDYYSLLSKNESEKPSPELTSSVPSRLTHFWVAGLLKAGYKGNLKEEEVFDLSAVDRCDTTVPIFEKGWEEEVARVDAYNEKVKANQPGLSVESFTPTSLKALMAADDAKEPNEKTALLSPDFQSNKTSSADIKDPFRHPDAGRVLFRKYGPYFFMAMTLKVVSDMVLFATPKITEALLEHVGKMDYPEMFPNEREWKGYVLAVSYMVVQTFSGVGTNLATLMSKRLGMHMKAMLISAVYKKSLSVSNTEVSAGEIVNLMAVDAQKVEEACMYVPICISVPFQIAMAVYMLYDQLDEAVFAGVGILFLGFPINTVCGIIMKNCQLAIMDFKDQRIKLISEVLNSMKVLKLYAWEGNFQERVEKIRHLELQQLVRFMRTIAFLIFVFATLPYVIKVVSFAVYMEISDDGYLSPTVAFVSMSLWDMLQYPMTMVPICFPMFIQTAVSVKRISAYLNMPDIREDNMTIDPSADSAVKIEDGEFTWDKSTTPGLRHVNLDVKQGSLVAIVGSVGSGKSSLLAAVMGEMERLKGKVVSQSTFAYVPQEAWVQNATVRENIVFGNPFRKSKYDSIIEACALKSDLEILPGGDNTEIGEKGINVSGGQKQRVSLARAVYSDRDIFLLDDPLSAVDSHVGKHIFNHVVGNNGLLKGKTRLLVTHGIHWLPLVDQVVVMSSGEIVEMGTYEQLIERNGAFAQFLQEHIQNEEENDTESEEDFDPEVEAMKDKVFERLMSVSGLSDLTPTTEDDDRKRSFVRSRSMSMSRRRSTRGPKRKSTIAEKKKKKSEAAVAGEKLIDEESQGSGEVKWEIFLHYLQANGLWSCALAGALYSLNCGAKTFTSIWLSEWTGDDYLADPSNQHKSKYDRLNNRYMSVYAAGGVGQGLFVMTFSLIAAFTMTRAARRLHYSMLSNIIRCPMSFFDTTPIGRIINRFSNDFELIDFKLPMSVQNTLLGVSGVVSAIIVMLYSTPIFITALAPLTVLYLFVLKVYLPTSRQLRRMDSVSRSPIYVHFSETLRGTTCIRAYGVQDRFLRESRDRLDHNYKFLFPGYVVNTWMTFWLGFLSNIVVSTAALFAIAGDEDSSVVGLSVSTAVSLTSTLQNLVQQFSEVQINIVAVERVGEYSDVPQEAAWVIPDRRPKPGWPATGKVTFKNYMTRYREGLDLVLRDVTCDIKDGEKIGIVGRTGAGKSSMTVALFRIIEAVGGQIAIDGVNIADMGLHDLRQKLTILPQDPVIFSGTLRMNIDPFEEHSDPELWVALEHAHMKAFVEGLPAKLDYECGEGGSNLSVGQRQLVCLARTLLRQTKILVLDEATAAVDFETDELIQETIRTQFTNCTILTIAHRLNTIMDYDRVMVLDKGYIKEFDSPSNLLMDKSTIFYSMAKQSGLT